MENVKRDTPNDKLNGLLNKMELFFTEMRHNGYLKTLPFYFSDYKLNLLRNISLIVAFVISGF